MALINMIGQQSSGSATAASPFTAGAASPATAGAASPSMSQALLYEGMGN